MKILVDENIPAITVEALQKLGHNVLDIRGTPKEGFADEKLWQLTLHESRLLITTDKGFTQHRNEIHQGILIIRLRKPNQNKIHQRIMKAFNEFSEDEWNGTLVVMRDTVQSVWRFSK